MAGTSRGPDPGRTTGAEPAAVRTLDQAGAQLRAPWAASVAGLLFALLFTVAVFLIRSSPIPKAGDGEIERLLTEGGDLGLVVGALYLAPFAGIMFLWFMAVVRDLVGDREDRFFATVFFGSGILFVAMLFASAAVAGSVATGPRFLDAAAPDARDVALSRALSYTLLFAFSTRAAAVFLISMGTIGLRSGVLPKWLVWTAWITGLVLLLVVSFFDWIVLILPAWVAIASVFILRRAHRVRRSGVAT